MRSTPSISFVIPTYNEEKNIEACLLSIIKQDYPIDKIEILVVDGYSKDKTLEIAKKYPVNIIMNKKRVTAEACNLGILNAKSDYLSFMGADSVLPQTDWVRLMIKPLLTDYLVVGSIPILMPNKRYPAISRFFSLMQADPIIVFAYGSGKNVNSAYITKENYFPMGLFVTRKENILNLKLKSSLQRSEDVDVTFRLVKAGYKFAIVQEAGLYHLFVGSFSGFLKKTYRRVKSFVQSTASECAFEYIPKKTHKTSFLFNLLFEVSGIGILRRLIQGIKNDRDIAWLYYPFVLYSTLTFYLVVFLTTSEGRRAFKLFLKNE